MHAGVILRVLEDVRGGFDSSGLGYRRAGISGPRVRVAEPSSFRVYPQIEAEQQHEVVDKSPLFPTGQTAQSAFVLLHMLTGLRMLLRFLSADFKGKAMSCDQEGNVSTLQDCLIREWTKARPYRDSNVTLIVHVPVPSASGRLGQLLEFIATWCPHRRKSGQSWRMQKTSPSYGIIGNR